MGNPKDGCKVVNFPTTRNVIIDSMIEGAKIHRVLGQTEIDVTLARECIRRMREEGQNVSFTGRVLYCVGQSVGEFKEVHAVKKGGKLYMFDDVDVSTTIERVTTDGHKIPVPVIVRSSNKKSFAEISAELNTAKTAEFTGMMLGKSREAKLASSFSKMPYFIRNIVWRKTRNDPFFRKKIMGTVILTSIGMFGPDGGWATAISPYPLEVVVGGIGKKPAVVEDRIEIREFMALTIGIDHDVVDGAPATRWTTRFCRLLQNACGLVPEPEETTSEDPLDA
jgi:pyruvate/2-oxoglutarate dehydrogenase complex dihydrolipoamide acyltransferase (E2) component